jgi:hypothetical protein
MLPTVTREADMTIVGSEDARSRPLARQADQELAEAVEALDEAQAELVETLHRYATGQIVPGEVWRARQRLDMSHRSLQATLLSHISDAAKE